MFRKIFFCSVFCLPHVAAIAALACPPPPVPPFSPDMCPQPANGIDTAAQAKVCHWKISVGLVESDHLTFVSGPFKNGSVIGCVYQSRTAPYGVLLYDNSENRN